MAATRPLDTFHPFPRLPKEIRIEIWKLHLVTMPPRTLTVLSYPPARWTHELQHFFSPDPVPPLLHVSQEARMEALPFYTKAFSNGLSPRYIWTNFFLDTIRMDSYNLTRVDFVDKAHIQQLIVEASDSEWFCDE